MRHLHFTQSLEPLQGGGLGASALALHVQLRARGHPSTLCATRGGASQSTCADVLEWRRRGPDALYFAPAMRRQAPRLTHDADVLHGHGLYVGSNFVFGREARRQRRPLVYHVHGMFEPYILQRSRWKKRLVHWLFENANFRAVRLWRALTPTEAGQIRALGLRQPIVIAPNGLDPAQFAAPADAHAPIRTALIAALTKERRRLLFLGRIHPKKGLDLLLAAWSQAASAARDWQLVIAGPDERGHLQTLREQARSLGLAGRVEFTGMVTGAARIQLLHSADLFVLPSRSEGFPMSILEALACAVPVIATRACNFPDLPAAGAGWECEPQVDSLAQVLRLALGAADDERRERGGAGRRLVAARYSWAGIVETLAQACAVHCA